ncbi:MAG: hypothetical protein WDM80_19230 [Limisphaerales bacterium]
MPIHINLLAEAQIVEDLRRRDPVKRAIYAGSFLVVLALVWSSSLQLKVVLNKSELNQVQARIQARTNEWQLVVDGQKKISDIRARLDALQKLSNARFLQGNLLNGLQQLNFEGVQLASLKVQQSYFKEQGAPPKQQWARRLRPAGERHGKNCREPRCPRRKPLSRRPGQQVQGDCRQPGLF